MASTIHHCGVIAQIENRQNVSLIKGAADELMLANLLMLLQIFQGHLFATTCELALMANTLKQSGSQQGCVVTQGSIAGWADCLSPCLLCPLFYFLLAGKADDVAIGAGWDGSPPGQVKAHRALHHTPHVTHKGLQSGGFLG